jgi:hypothetical protein
MGPWERVTRGSRQRCGVVVDGYSGGAALARELRRAGYDCVHVQSTLEIPPCYRRDFNADDWLATLVFAGEVDDLAARLREAFAPDFVSVGAHEGIWLADVLSEALGFPANGAAGRRLHLDKHLAAEALAVAEVPGPVTFAARTVEEGIAGAARIGSWPVVVKPINSAGSDGVSCCLDPADVERACRALLGNRDALNQINETLVIAQWVSGPAYATQTISVDSRHFLVAVLEFCKRPSPVGGDIYDCFRLVSPTRRALWEQLEAYARRYLDALRFTTGPALGEVMLTDEGPMLIELNARLAGAGTGSCAEIEAALGHTHASAYALRLCDPEAFIRRFEIPFCMATQVWFVSIAAFEHGVVGSLAGLARIESLPSFSAHVWKPELGDLVRPCVDQLTIPALVVLSDRDEAVVRADYEQIRSLELDDVFGLREAPR